jgi:hypothetical protein
MAIGGDDPFGSGKSFGELNFAVLLGVAWLVIALALFVQYWGGTAESLYDTDDAMRLVQMRAWLDGQGWFDLHQARVQPPLGFDSHWSRLIDAGLAGLLLLFRQFTDPASAERLMRAVWPLIWLFPTMGGMAAIAWRLAGREAAVVALVLAMLGTPAYQQFIPGRIDHHNVQIALTLLTVAATVWSDRLRFAAPLAGLLSGLALAIGLESLPYLVVCAGALGLRYVLDRRAAWPLQAYVLARVASTLAGFFVSVGPDRWTHRACDTIAINLVVPIVVAAIALMIAGLAKQERRASRFALIGFIGAVTLTYEPRCLAGPFAMVDPSIWSIWLADVRELQPLITMLQKNPLTAAGIATFPAAALIAALVLAREHELRADFGFVTAAAALLSAAAVTLAAIRGFSYAMWLGMPLVALLALRLFAALKLRTVAARLVAGLMLSPMALSGAAITIADAAGLDDREDFTRPESKACFKTANYAALAALPPGLVVTDVSYGPFLLALTPHSVMAAPYHLLSTGIIEAHRALASPPDQARAVLARTHATYVMICGPRPPAGLAEPARGASLWGRLQAGVVPDWLERVTPSVAHGRVTRRNVRLIRPPSGSSVEVPGTMRSTPWKASRALPPSTSASPDARRKACVGSPRRVPPTRNRQVSPSDKETTGASKSCSSRS